MMSWKRYRPCVPAVLLCITAAAGCRQPQSGPDSAADSAFVLALADLRRAVLPGGAETTRDSTGRAMVRDSILRKYHVTAANLEDIARRLAQNPEQASLILHAVDRHVQLAMGSAPPRPPGVVPPGMLRPGPNLPGQQVPGAASGAAAAGAAPPATTPQSNVDARALLNTLHAQSAASGKKIPPSAGVIPR
jgi:hypothetical protein